MDLPFVRTIQLHWSGRTKLLAVPKTWQEAHSVFWLHPTPMVAVFVLFSLIVYRAGVPLSPVIDVAALAVGVGLWICQEWCVYERNWRLCDAANWHVCSMLKQFMLHCCLEEGCPRSAAPHFAVLCRFVHARLFHGTVEWFGKEIHHQHHKEPYYHISIDGAHHLLIQ